MAFLKSVYSAITGPFRKSIRNKLILIMVVLTVLPVIIVTLLATDNTRASMEDEVLASNLSRIGWTGDYLEQELSGLNTIVYTIFISPALNEYLRVLDETSNASLYDVQKEVIDTITSVSYSANENLFDIQLYMLKNHKQFKISMMQTAIKTPPHIPDMYLQMIAGKEDYLIQNSTETPGYFELTRSLNRFETKEQLGFVTLKVNWKITADAMDLINPGLESTVFIADQAGKIMFQPSGTQKQEDVEGLLQQMGSGPGYLKTKDNYVFYDTLDPWGLKLVKMIPMSQINQSARTTLQYGLIVGAVSIVVSLAIAIIMAWTSSKPIVKLARSMQNLSFMKDENISPTKRVDEIGLLELKMYNMSQRIRDHIKTEYSINLEKQTAQLKALQAQINPHFLQNTLQLIGGMAFSQTPDRLYAVIKALSDMFRYVIREPNEWVELEKEFNHLRNYLFIQGQRYPNRIVTQIVVEPGLEICQIPKLILQPIAENAFMHGFDLKSSSWTLTVKAARYGQGMLITVQDNGKGMSAERLDRVNRKLQIDADSIGTSGDHIGLSNVAARIRLHDGPDYGVTMESVLGLGTTVRIYLPMTEMGDH